MLDQRPSRESEKTDLRISPTGVQQQAVAKLRAAILDGMFVQGQRLVEADLCEKIGISRPSLREALRSLEAEKLIQIVPNKGPIIPIMSWQEAQQIYVVRSLIEGEAAALCAQNISDEDAHHLRAALEAFAAADKAADSKGRLETTTRFYQIIFRASANMIIEEIASGLLARINFLRQRSMSHAGRGRHSLAEMTAIVDAIVSRSPEAARLAAEKHVDFACEAARRVFESEISLKPAPRKRTSRSPTGAGDRLR